MCESTSTEWGSYTNWIVIVSFSTLETFVLYNFGPSWKLLGRHDWIVIASLSIFTETVVVYAITTQDSRWGIFLDKI